MKYGLDLTRKLFNEMKYLAELNHGKFVIFYTQEPKEKGECLQEEVVHLLNGQYYKTSNKQYIDNLTYLIGGYISFPIPITISNFRVSPKDSHLNERANNLVMSDLSESLRPYIY